MLKPTVHHTNAPPNRLKTIDAMKLTEATYQKILQSLIAISS
jgi:hypothetical protein